MEEIDEFPKNLREYLLDTLTRPNLSRIEIEALNEIMGDIFWIWIDIHEIKRPQNFHFRNLHPKCEKCGKPITTIHHKDRNPRNNNSSNLMAVCSSCHIKIHTNQKSKSKTYILYPYWNNIFKARLNLECVSYEG
jgi:hypothetical protein